MPLSGPAAGGSAEWEEEGEINRRKAGLKGVKGGVRQTRGSAWWIKKKGEPYGEEQPPRSGWQPGKKRGGSDEG